MSLVLLLTALAGWASPVPGPEPGSLVDLKPATAAAFEAYIHGVEAQIDERVAGKKNFLWLDDSPERRARAQRGEAVVERSVGTHAVAVPDGLIHDWIGAVFIKGVALTETIAFVQDYNHHKEFYGPEVVDARIISRDDEHFVLFMRLMKKKFTVTAVLDTEHDAQFVALDKTRWYSRSRTTKVTEVQNAGTPQEHIKPAGSGSGYMWNLNSYWRFAERDGGVYVECRAVSLSRDIPWIVRWLISPIVSDLPKDSLVNTLTATRAGVLARASAARKQP